MEVPTLGKLTPDFTLPDHLGGVVTLSQAVQSGPVLLAFYPRDFTPVCTKQLCGYSTNFDAFQGLGIQVFGISENPPESHVNFAKKYDFPFKLLTDAKHTVARSFGCTSMFMLGLVSRACFIVSKERTLLYRHVEPTILTHRNAAELLAVMQDLRARQLI